MASKKLTCGLEVHQQLDTGKLFSRYPTRLTEQKPDFAVKRRIRAVASELGAFDAAAREAAQKGYTYVYEGTNDTAGLVELDEEPPQPLNPEALDVTLTVAALCRANVIPRVFVMRKIVADGSNTSGFQRTALLATGGELETESGQKVGIQTIALEEDAARPASRDEEKREVTYKLDRLGIPLIELATEPCLHSPEQVKDAARAIGEVMRLTCKAKRGLGTIRQDINISIEGGARIEIKGCQEIDLFDDYVSREVARQEHLLALKDELKRRGVNRETLGTPRSVDVSAVFAKSECKMVRNKSVFACRVPRFAGLLGRETLPGKRFGSEVAAYVKARAGLRGIFHSDELPAYGMTDAEVKKVREAAKCEKEDAFVMVACDPNTAQKAFVVALERCAIAAQGVPEETRNPLGDGNTEYARPLPGADRMYPETDIAPVPVDEAKMAAIRAHLPRRRAARVTAYQKEYGLSKQLAEKMALDNFALFFEDLAQKGFSPTQVAVVLLEKLTELRRKKGLSEDDFYARVTPELIYEALEKMQKGEVTRERFLEYLDARAFEGKRAHEVSGGADEAQIKTAVEKVVAQNRKVISEKGERAVKVLMGLVMKELRGRANGATVSRLLEQEIAKAK